MAQIATRVSDKEKELFEKYCKEHDITVSQLIRKAIKEYLKDKDILVDE